MTGWLMSYPEAEHRDLAILPHLLTGVWQQQRETVTVSQSK